MHLWIWLNAISSTLRAGKIKQKQAACNILHDLGIAQCHYHYMRILQARSYRIS
jgi:hypothetical protein